MAHHHQRCDSYLAWSSAGVSPAERRVSQCSKCIQSVTDAVRNLRLNTGRLKSSWPQRIATKTSLCSACSKATVCAASLWIARPLATTYSIATARAPLRSVHVRPHQLLYRRLHRQHPPILRQTVLVQPPSPAWNRSATGSSSCTKHSRAFSSTSSSALPLPPLPPAPFLLLVPFCPCCSRPCPHDTRPHLLPHPTHTALRCL